MNRNAFAFLGLLAVLPLTGCISLAPKPPARLMTLTAASPLAPGTAITTGDDKAVQIARLGAIPALSTQRVLVTDGPTGIAYLKGGLWAAQPTDLFRGLLAETPVDHFDVSERPSVIFRVNPITWVDATVRYLVAPRNAGRRKTALTKRIIERLNAAPDRVMFPAANTR